jgi:DNA-binding transcriptional ArsR family regulator
LNSNDSDSNDKKKDKDNHDDKDDRIGGGSELGNEDPNNKKRMIRPDKPVDPRFKRLLWYLIASTRGGVNRAKIINFLSESPSNANQLSNQLKLDYKTIVHHLDVLVKNGLIITENEESYGATYFISPIIEKNYSAFKEIMATIGKK